MVGGFGSRDGGDDLVYGDLVPVVLFAVPDEDVVQGDMDRDSSRRDTAGYGRTQKCCRRKRCGLR